MPAKPKPNESRSRSLDVMIGVAAVIAVLVIVVFMRPRTQDEDSNTPRPLQPAALEPLKLSERLRPRSNAEVPAPREAREKLPGERLVVQPVAPTTPSKMKQRAAAAPGVAGDTEASPRPAVSSNLEPEQIDLDDASEDIGALTKVVFGDPDPERRVAAVELLSATEDPQVITVLARALADENEEVRMAALQSLSDFTGEAPTLAIEGALRDPSPDIRYEAVSMLAELSSDRARAAIHQMLNDPDDDVRFLAESVLEMHKQPDQGSVPAAPAQELPAQPQAPDR